MGSLLSSHIVRQTNTENGKGDFPYSVTLQYGEDISAVVRLTKSEKRHKTHICVNNPLRIVQGVEGVCSQIPGIFVVVH